VAIRDSYAQCETVQSASDSFTMVMVTAVYVRLNRFNNVQLNHKCQRWYQIWG